MRRSIKILIVIAIVGAMLSVIGAGVVLANGGDSDSKGDSDRETRRAELQADFAEALGVTPETLVAAIQQVVLDRIDAAVADGKISEEKASEWRTAVESGERPKLRWAKIAGGDREAAAEALTTELGVTVADLSNARQQVVLDRLDAAVADGKISEEEAAEKRAAIESGEFEWKKGKRDFGKHFDKDCDKDGDSDDDPDYDEDETVETE